MANDVHEEFELRVITAKFRLWANPALLLSLIFPFPFLTLFISFLVSNTQFSSLRRALSKVNVSFSRNTFFTTPELYFSATSLRNKMLLQAEESSLFSEIYCFGL